MSSIIENVTRMAKAVTASKAFDSETKKAARAFLKRTKAKRESGVAALLSVVATAMGLEAGASLENIYDAMCDSGFMTDGQFDTDDASDGMAPADKEVFEHNQEIDAAVEPQTPSETHETAAQPAEAAAPQPTPQKASKGRQKAADASVPGAPVQGLDAGEGKHLGDLVGWSLSGMISADRVEAAIKKFGLEDDIRLPKLTNNSAYRKAIQLAFNAGKKEERVAMAVLVEDNAKKIVHSLVNKSVVDDDDDTVSNKDAEFKTEIKVGFNKLADQQGATASGCLVTEDDNHPAAKILRAKYAELTENYTTDGIRSGFQVAFKKWDACPVLPHGGLWYIPAKHAEKVRAWVGFMRELNQQSALIPTFNTHETIESLKESTRNGLESQLQEMFNLLEEYATLGWDKCRVTTLEKRMEDFDELRGRAEFYQAMLGTTIDDLTAKIEAAAKTVMGRLEQRREEEADKAAEKAKAEAAKKEEERKAREAEKAKAKAAAAPAPAKAPAKKAAPKAKAAPKRSAAAATATA